MKISVFNCLVSGNVLRESIVEIEGLLEDMVETRSSIAVASLVAFDGVMTKFSVVKDFSVILLDTDALGMPGDEGASVSGVGGFVN